MGWLPWRRESAPVTYRTSDGFAWTTRWEAELHQLRLDNIERLYRALGEQEVQRAKREARRERSRRRQQFRGAR